MNHRYFTPSTKEEFDNQNIEWVPQKGEYVLMENAGGYGYSPRNNGCIAIINAVCKTSDGKTYTISGKIINPKSQECVIFTNIPIKSPTGQIICKRAYVPEIGDWVIVTEQYTCNYAFKGMVGQITDLDLSSSIPYQVNGSWCLNVRKAEQYELTVKAPSKFALPEKWCIKWISEEVFLYCKQYFGGNWVYIEDSWSINDESNYWSHTNNSYPTDNGYTEITLEQFLNYVLKKVDLDESNNIRSSKKPEEITIPKLITREKTSVKLNVSHHLGITINITPKIIPKIQKLIIKPVKIQTK